MRIFRILVAAALPLALGACGGASRSEFTNSAPTYPALAIDMSASEVANGMGGVAMAVTGQDAVMPTLDCHPHLFVRTDVLATRINRHLWKFLRHVEFLIARHPDQLSTGQAVWDRIRGDVEVKLTITKVSDVEFSWLLQMRLVGSPDWAAIFSGDIDRTGAGPHQGKGHAHLDLTALKNLLIDEPRGMVGVIDAKFETFADHRLLVVDAVGVNWDFAMDADIPPALQVPRNAHYVSYREPGKGGSFKAHDQMAFVCPVVADIAPALADVQLITRFYRAADGSVHGRSDGQVTGGQLPDHVPPIARVEGVTCSAGAADGADQAERFWLVKGEDEFGGTVIGWEVPSPPPSGFGPEACDPLLNEPTGVPDLVDSSHDYDFSAVNFDDDLPAQFPHP